MKKKHWIWEIACNYDEMSKFLNVDRLFNILLSFLALPWILYATLRMSMMNNLTPWQVHEKSSRRNILKQFP